jgi:hypothetical protein
MTILNKGLGALALGLMLCASAALAGQTIPDSASTAAGAYRQTVPVVGLNFGPVAPTVTVQAAAYSAGNSEGGVISAPVAAANGGAFTLAALRLKSTGGSTNTVWIYAWTKTPASTCTDKAAFVFNAADQAFALPGFPVQAVLGGSPGAWDTSTYAQVLGLNVPGLNQDTTPGQNLYLCIVTAGAVTPASTADLSIALTGWN